MTYKWRAGSRIKADPTIAVAQMQQLEAEGNLTAKGLLDANRPEGAPLHNEFEWNDSIAAEKYRESQARHLINSLVVVREDVGPVRNFFQITSGDSRYSSLSVILESEDDRGTLLRMALRELESFRAKYSKLEELAGVFDAIQKVAG